MVHPEVIKKKSQMRLRIKLGKKPLKKEINNKTYE